MTELQHPKNEHVAGDFDPSQIDFGYYPLLVADPRMRGLSEIILLFIRVSELSDPRDATVSISVDFLEVVPGKGCNSLETVNPDLLA